MAAALGAFESEADLERLGLSPDRQCPPGARPQGHRSRRLLPASTPRCSSSSTAPSRAGRARASASRFSLSAADDYIGRGSSELVEHLFRGAGRAVSRCARGPADRCPRDKGAGGHLPRRCGVPGPAARRRRRRCRGCSSPEPGATQDGRRRWKARYAPVSKRPRRPWRLFPAPVTRNPRELEGAGT